MENCVAPGLDEFDVIIRSCIVFSQSNLNVTRRLVCISYIENESRNTSRKFTQNALPWLDLPGFEVFILVRGSRQNQNQSITHNYFWHILNAFWIRYCAHRP